jgi:hypothetical protein
LSHNPYLNELSVMHGLDETQSKQIQLDLNQIFDSLDEKRVKDELSTYERAHSASKISTKINDVYKACKAGQVDTLWLEEGSELHVKHHSLKDTYIFCDEAEEDCVDLMDEMIHLAISHRAQIFVYPKGTLPGLSVASINRY